MLLLLWTRGKLIYVASFDPFRLLILTPTFVFIIAARPPTLIGESIGGLSVPWRHGVFNSVGQQYVNARAVVARRNQRVRCAPSTSAHAPLHDYVMWSALLNDFVAHHLQAGIGGGQFTARQWKWVESRRRRQWWRRRNEWRRSCQLSGLLAL